MVDSVEKRFRKASRAGADEIARFLHDSSGKVITALLQNSNLSEQDVLILANRKNLSGAILETIGKDKRWAESYPVRLALARNPKTPLFVALSIARYLRLFDLADITRSHLLPLTYRHKIEAILMEKIPTMALGVKKTLAKTAAGNVLSKLLQDGNRDIVNICLNNPYLTEGHLTTVINRHDAPAIVIRLISEHPNWSNRYSIKYTLIRNSHLTLSRCVQFLQEMRITDLRELYIDPAVPVSVRPYIHSEIVERGEKPEKEGEEERIYEITAEERQQETEEQQ